MSELRSFIHSVESFGSVDGPGIRFILFTQGCGLRCQYCHNPDSWRMKDGKDMPVSEVMDHLLKYKEFFETSGGGITVSGGEPLLQMPYVTELFKQCKAHGIHTNIDTSGDIRITTDSRKEQLRELLKYTDMVMLDIKMMDAEKHKFLTGKTNEHILDLGRFISDNGTKMWIRRVLVPGLTDDEGDLKATADYIRTLKSVEKVEVLPYHSMGAYKWEQMGYEYELKDVETPDEASVDKAESILQTALA
ncbi:MAG: pyruvate formate-lyase-activating protein [Turicibacter sp.]|nr:pyruvate formate-lyase-activating protein [Turicibacter sp.]